VTAKARVIAESVTPFGAPWVKTAAELLDENRLYELGELRFQDRL
jgi:hypothetical protein